MVAGCDAAAVSDIAVIRLIDCNHLIIWIDRMRM